MVTRFDGVEQLAYATFSVCKNSVLQGHIGSPAPRTQRFFAV